jgi:hypothetical protein
MAKTSEDPIKKIFGKTAEELFSTPSEPHSKFHSSNAFCGNAGPEEMKHFQHLLDVLTDQEITQLVDAVGITFDSPTTELDRSTLEGVLDEADREDFYREYNNLIDRR